MKDIFYNIRKILFGVHDKLSIVRNYIIKSRLIYFIFGLKSIRTKRLYF